MKRPKPTKKIAVLPPAPKAKLGKAKCGKHKPTPVIAPPPTPRPYRPNGLILALQYWKGDEEKAIRLAKLLADIEPVQRNDCLLMFCRANGTALTPGIVGAMNYCRGKLPTSHYEGIRMAQGYPAGPNELWASVMQFLCDERAAHRIHFESVFTFEADGVPLRKDWLDIMIAAHSDTITQGLLVTGARMHRHYMPHINGNLITHLSMWEDHDTLHRTPQDTPWDMHHHVVLSKYAKAGTVIRNEYNSGGWTEKSLTSLAQESAWLHGCRDETAWAFAQGLKAKKDNAHRTRR